MILASSYQTVLAEFDRMMLSGRLPRRELVELRRHLGARFTAVLKLTMGGFVESYVFKTGGRVQ
ncbi:MAG: hypothetical protein QXL91_01390 [Candidatus Bathyarchaeia archaeon]|nr:hypothetical protein [Candidatus Bathyarchaeota archaeon]